MVINAVFALKGWFHRYEWQWLIDLDKADSIDHYQDKPTLD